MRKGIKFITLLAFSAMMIGCNTFAPKSSSFDGENSSSTSSEPAYVPVESISLNQTELVLPLGEEFALNATVYPENATNKGVSFQVENPYVAFVSYDGVVEGNGKGVTRVKVTSNDNVSIEAYCNVTITFSSVQEINFDQEEVTVKMGKSAKLTAIVEPSTAPTELTWSSSNEEIVTIENGIITPHGIGSATINVVSPFTSGASATCVVHVVNDVDSGSAFKLANNNTTYYQIDSRQYVQNHGEQKVLVLPTYFSGEAKPTEEQRLFIEKSFFGSNDDCGWRSFSGYYSDASFGQLHYSGHINSYWYKAPYSIVRVRNEQNLSQIIAAKALKNFQDKNPTFDLSEYDSNNDGFIDSLYIIYAADYDRQTTTLWGYRWSVEDDTENVTGKKAGAFSWFSLKFLTETYDYGGVPEDGSNTRIIIHEHGHMLGLPDYYDYGYTGIDCVGGYDMQSYNTFDWNAYSKYSVGWVKPYYVDIDKLRSKGSETITIGDSTTTGDCILLKNSSWNGTPFDEYLMIELFNPDAGNNYYDSHYNYDGGPQKCGFGVKIFHVDARLMDISFNDSEKTATVVPVTNFNTMSDWAFWPNDNNAKSSSEKNSTLVYYKSVLKSYYHYTLDNWEEFYNYNFLQLLQKGNVDTFTKVGNYRHDWNETDLWKTGDTFTIGEKVGYTDYGPSFFYKQSTFNDGTDFPFGLSFDNVTKNSATITISYF